MGDPKIHRASHSLSQLLLGTLVMPQVHLAHVFLFWWRDPILIIGLEDPSSDKQPSKFSIEGHQIKVLLVAESRQLHVLIKGVAQTS